MNYLQEFLHWYYDEFQTTELYQSLTTVREGSPHHQERSVAAHTDMVVSYYCALAGNNWGYEDVFGAFACAFHDVGKVSAMHLKEGEKDRYTFHGHEKSSARLWEDWAVKNFRMLEERFGFLPNDIYRIGWMIQSHLIIPLSNLRKTKRSHFVKTLCSLFHKRSVFYNFILADSLGRKCENNKNEYTNNWIYECQQFCMVNDNETCSSQHLRDFTPVLYVLIGPQACGKSTHAKGLSYESQIYSWDDLRMKWYISDEERIQNPKDLYTLAYERQLEDDDFNSKADKVFMDLVRERKNIILDNTNYTKARRSTYVNAAQQAGYRLVAILFPISIEELFKRHHERKDKFIPWGAVMRMYMGLELPQYGEFHDIYVEKKNLPQD